MRLIQKIADAKLEQKNFKTVEIINSINKRTIKTRSNLRTPYTNGGHIVM